MKRAIRADGLVGLLYTLLRDDVTVGRLEQLVIEHVEKGAGKQAMFSNEYLHAYAAELADRIDASNAGRPEELIE